MSIEPHIDPPPLHGIVPTPGLWRNGAFVRVWSAATISVFGSLVTRIALPFVAVLVLHAGPIEMAALRSVDLVAAVLVGFVAGAWVDRLRRRPVLIWADLGRAILLGSVPVAALGGWLTLAQLLFVTAAAAVLTTAFDVADRAYLPTIVERDELVRANGALVATSSGAEFAAFGVAGFLVQALTAPIAIAVDAVSFVVSAVILGSIRRSEPAPPPPAQREPILDEIRVGVRLVARDPVLLGLLAGSMALGAMWGIFGATWLLFITGDLGFDPPTVGLVAALGGLGSLVGAVGADRAVRRFGLGAVVIGALLAATLGNLLMGLAPVGAPLVALACLIGQQLIGDGGVVIFEITEASVRQARVDGRQLGRVNATVQVATVSAQLVGTIVAGVLAVAIGLRGAILLAPVAAMIGVVLVWASPVRTMRSLEAAAD
jgi:MFS family permease